MTEHTQQYHDLDQIEITFSRTFPSTTAVATRVRHRGWWYFCEYQLLSMRGWAGSILIAALGNPLVYLMAMGLGLGAAVGSHTGTVDGVSYLVFVAPALLVSTAVMSVMEEMSYPVLGGFLWSRTYYAAQATPLQPWQLALGHVVAVVMRFLLQATIFYLMMIIFDAAPSPWAWLTIGVGMLSAVSFGIPLMAFSATRETGEDGSITLIQRFVVMPMFLFAGTFFPLDVMPVYLHWIGWISPIWHGTQLARVASYGSLVPMWLVFVHLVFLMTTAGLGMWFAARAFNRRLSS